MANNKWVAWVAVIALILAIVSLILVLSGGLTGGAVYSSTLGQLSVTTNPEGANVYINDVLKGTTPAVISSLTQGSYNVKLKKPGYYDSSTYEYIYPGKTTELFKDLTIIA